MVRAESCEYAGCPAAATIEKATGLNAKMPRERDFIKALALM
jgi:hypothetical protein